MKNTCTLILILITLKLSSQEKTAVENDPPKIFMRDKISTGNNERDMTISPNGDELFYTVQHPKSGYSQIVYMKKNGKNWSAPQVASFSGKYSDLEASFSHDGNKIYFVSNRPLTPDGKIKDHDIWVTERKNGKWETPVNLGENVNSEEDEFYPSVGKTGNLYFTATRKNGIGKEDIFMSRYENGKYTNAVPLDTGVNSTLYEFNAFVSPDESFIIFTGYGRKDDMGRGDLYISKKNADGEWERAVNMGAKINSPFLDYCPFVSFDKKTFYFTSERTYTKGLYDKTKTFTEFNSFLNKPENGNGDIYFIPFNY